MNASPRVAARERAARCGCGCGGGPPSRGSQSGPEFEEGGAVLTQLDVMSPRIDVFAQRALFRMLSASSQANADARAMVTAVKTGRLRGIYKEDEKVPALRAIRLGTVWWKIIPAGADAVCLGRPAGEAPLLVFRDQVRANANRLDPALAKAWRSCGISVLPLPYRPTAFPQPPKPPKPPTVVTFPPDVIKGPPPRPARPAPTCDPKDLRRRLKECDSNYAKCAALGGLNTVIERVKAMGSGIPGCLKAIETRNIPRILYCAYKLGVIDIDTTLNYKRRIDNCAAMLGPCRYVARLNSHCMSK